MSAQLLVPLACYIVAAVLLGTGYHLWQDLDSSLYVVAMWSSLTAYVLAFALVWYGSLQGAPLRSRENLAVAGLVAAFVLYAANYLAFKSSTYSTDALLFNTYSAEIAVHGANPYVQSMEPAFSYFDAPRNLITQTTTGAPVFAQSYPALSFLIYVPFVLLGVNALWASVMAHALLISLLACMAPRPLKMFAPLILFVDPSYIQYSLGSVNDVLWAVPMLLAAYYWRSNPVRAGIFLGIASCIKQVPWVVVPFALIYWVQRAWRLRRTPEAGNPWYLRALEPAAAMVLAFAVPNLPFIISNARAWLRGVTTPIAGQLVDFGSGIVQLTTSNVMVFDRFHYELFTCFALVALLSLYAWRSRALAFLPFIAPALVLFLASRSLQNYFMFWPVILIGFGFGRTEGLALGLVPAAQKLRLSTWVAAVASVGALFLVVGVSSTFRPVEALRLEFASYGYDLNTNAVSSLVLHARNDEDSTRTLRFGVYSEGNGVGFTFWQIKPVPIRPRSEVSIHLRAPNVQSELPASGESVQIVAVDAASGTSTFSNPRQIYQPPGGFANGGLTAWNQGPPATPAGWDFSEMDFVSRRVYRAKDGRRSVLAFHIQASAKDEWTVASVGQTVTGDMRPFYVSLRPYSTYVGNAYPLEIFGLELVDAFGHHAYFAIDPDLMRAEVYKRDNFTTFLFPGALGAWNSIRIDPVRLARDAQFILSQETQVKINVVAAAHKGQRDAVGGDFGGFSV